MKDNINADTCDEIKNLVEESLLHLLLVLGGPFGGPLGVAAAGGPVFLLNILDSGFIFGGFGSSAAVFPPCASGGSVLAAGSLLVEAPHVEDVDILRLCEDLETSVVGGDVSVSLHEERNVFLLGSFFGLYDADEEGLKKAKLYCVIQVRGEDLAYLVNHEGLFVARTVRSFFLAVLLVCPHFGEHLPSHFKQSLLASAVAGVGGRLQKVQARLERGRLSNLRRLEYYIILSGLFMFEFAVVGNVSIGGCLSSTKMVIDYNMDAINALKCIGLTVAKAFPSEAPAPPRSSWR